MPVCIVSISGGNCASVIPGKIQNKKHEENDKTQQWIVERKDDNKFAFKSVSNGQYLRAAEGRAYGLITTGEKQWWISEAGDAPEALWYSEICPSQSLTEH